MNNDIVFCFFGFYRDGFSKNYNFDITKHQSYIFSPKIRNEDKTEVISKKHLKTKFGNQTIINQYNYNKNKFIKKANKLNIPRFNQFFQQAYRIFSFFYNVKGVLEMLPEQTDSEQIIFISRIDIGLKIKDFNKIHDILQTHDVITGRIFNNNSMDDKWFITKYKNIRVFKNLFDEYEKYLTAYYHNRKSVLKLKSTKPEDVFKFHFDENNIKYKATNFELIEYDFRHVCSPFCGHNRNNTQT